MNPKLMLGLIVAVLALSSSATTIAGPSFQTKLSIAYSPSSGGQFAGHVRSHAGCVAGREVSVYRKGPGRDPLTGTGTARPGGRWSVPVAQIPAGDYYAKAPAMHSSAGTCAAAKSATTHVS